MEKEDLRKAIIELLGEDEITRTGKKFFFPENVEKGYNLVPGLSITDVVKFLLPSCLVSILILVIPPYSSVLLWIMKSIIICIILSLGVVIAILRPVKSRNNIKFLDYIKTRIEFTGKQKTYYLKPKKRR